MARSAAAKKRQRANNRRNCAQKRTEQEQRIQRTQSAHSIFTPTLINESNCHYCCNAATKQEDQSHESQREGTFRFMDLPPELRNRIYEYACTSSVQPVCIPDRFLRPSGLSNLYKPVARQCTLNAACVPCQLHDALGTGHIGLSRANKQLHSEMALIPYTVNTFSVHSLYYLEAFLRIIGWKGRSALKSLRFDWKYPEEEARALSMYTHTAETYLLLRECRLLTHLEVLMDLKNLCTWKEDGEPRYVRLTNAYKIPHFHLFLSLGGFKDIRIGWKQAERWKDGNLAKLAMLLVLNWRARPSMSAGDAVAAPVVVKSKADIKFDHEDGDTLQVLEWKE